MRKWILLILPLIFSIVYSADNALEVRTDVPSVNVYLDDVYQGETKKFGDMNIFRQDSFEPGKYSLKCTHKDYDPSIREIEIPKEGTFNIEVNFLMKNIEVVDIMEKGKGHQFKQTGVIFVRSSPTGATISLNGQSQRSNGELLLTDKMFNKIPVGMIGVTCNFGDSKELSGRFQLSGGDTARVMADFFTNKMEIRIKYKVTIASKPEGDIFIDGELIGQGMVTIPLYSGNYNLVIKKKGYKNLVKEIVIEGQNLFTYTLESNFAPIKILTEPEDKAVIYLNDEKIGVTPFSDEMMPAGSYKIKIKKEGWANINENLVIEPNKPLTKTYTLAKNRGSLSVSAVSAESGEAVADMGVWLNENNTEQITPSLHDLIVGKHNIELSHSELISIKANITAKITKDAQKSLVFSVANEPWFKKKQSFWAKNKWSGLIATGVFAGTGILFNSLSNSYHDKYTDAETTDDAMDYKNKTNDFESYRDICYYASGSTSLYTLWSWYKNVHYKNRIKNRRR